MMRPLVVALSFAAVLVVSRAAEACSCMIAGPPCQMVWQSDAVFDGVVTAIENVSSAEPQVRHLAIREKLVTFQVRASWRGDVPATVSVVTGVGGGDCGYAFRLNHRYLVYAFKRAQDGRLGVGICSRTRQYDGTGDEAAYLESLRRPATSGGRIFGDVRGSAAPIETQVHVTGPDGTTRTLSSSKDGGFEFTNLPVGRYTVRVVAPPGMEAYEASRSVEVPDGHACVRVDFSLRNGERIEGPVIRGDGLREPPIGLRTAGDRSERGRGADNDHQADASFVTSVTPQTAELLVRRIGGSGRAAPQPWA